MEIEARAWVLAALAGVHIWIAAVVVWSIWIQRYIEKHLKRPAPFWMAVCFGFGSIMDYRKARRISRKMGQKPWFLFFFEGLVGLAVVSIVAAAWLVFF